jgi:hypothetical protein
VMSEMPLRQAGKQPDAPRDEKEGRSQEQARRPPRNSADAEGRAQVDELCRSLVKRTLRLIPLEQLLPA